MDSSSTGCSPLLPAKLNGAQCWYLAFVSLFLAVPMSLSDKQNLKRNVSPEAAIVCCEWLTTRVQGDRKKMLPFNPSVMSLACGACRDLATQRDVYTCSTYFCLVFSVRLYRKGLAKTTFSLTGGSTTTQGTGPVP